MLIELQNGLERLYRIETDLCVEDFLLDESARAEADVERAPREQLLLAEDVDGLSVGLFLDQNVLANLGRVMVLEDIEGEELEAFLLALEGVSHFVYVTWKAKRDASVSALELELQAEVDKFVTCLLSGVAPTKELRRRLYVDVEFHQDLSDEERERYQLANRRAYQYTGWLERKYLKSKQIPAMLREVRSFYRLPLDGKILRIRECS